MEPKSFSNRKQSILLVTDSQSTTSRKVDDKREKDNLKRDKKTANMDIFN